MVLTDVFMRLITVYITPVFVDSDYIEIARRR